MTNRPPRARGRHLKESPDRALARSERSARRLTLITMVPIVAIEVVLYLAGVNAVVLALAPPALGSIFAAAMSVVERVQRSKQPATGESP